MRTSSVVHDGKSIALTRTPPISRRQQLSCSRDYLPARKPGSRLAQGQYWTMTRSEVTDIEPVGPAPCRAACLRVSICLGRFRRCVVDCGGSTPAVKYQRWIQSSSRELIDNDSTERTRSRQARQMIADLPILQATHPQRSSVSLAKCSVSCPAVLVTNTNLQDDSDARRNAAFEVKHRACRVSLARKV